MTDETPKSFYKYYSVEGAIATLCYETRRWTKPSAFNDPFDNQIQQRIKELSTENIHRYKGFEQETIKDFLRIIKGSIPFSMNKSLQNSLPNFPEWENFLVGQRDKYRLNPNKFKRNQFARELKEFATTNPKIAKTLINGINKKEEELKKLLDPNNYNKFHLIFCISKNEKSILMWSHYAQSHQGVVIEFLPSHELSNLKKVKYLLEMPEKSEHPFTYKDDKDFWKIYDDNLVLTKSDCWVYEQEWRAIKYLENNPNDYIDLPFDRNEVSAIYLGCRIEPERKKEIIIIAKEKYSHAKIFQARTHESEYSLVFDEIL
jgi:hypothetical protein